jgi:hypothetical protein
MKKSFVIMLFAMTAMLIFAQNNSAEAREHRNRSRTSVSVNFGNYYGGRDAYVVRRYARPAQVMYTTPVYVSSTPTYYSTPTYAAPVYVQSAPVYVQSAPTYVEEVRVAPAIRPFALGGLSFSWNFFK